MVTKLVAAGAALTLRSNEEGWCTVDLTLPDKTFCLGAEVRDWVLDHLAAALEKQLAGKVSGVVDGLSVVWGMSLSELHCSMYVADRDGQRVLIFQDANASWFARVVLSDEERELWLAQLRAEQRAAAPHRS